MPYVYILASRPNGTLYVGSTVDLARRVFEHKSKAVDGFTKSYGVDRLVWFEEHADLQAAQAREWRMKRWKRDWKISLIEASNPHWIDLYASITR
jgi:putative endonuclease